MKMVLKKGRIIWMYDCMSTPLHGWLAQIGQLPMPTGNFLGDPLARLILGMESMYVLLVATYMLTSYVHTYFNPSVNKYRL